MREVTRKGLMTVMAATGAIAAASGYAHADSGASGVSTNSPGVLSGNTIQVPVDIPVNVCGNTVDVIGLLNPAMGNKCANGDGGTFRSGGHDRGDHRGHDGDGRGGYGDHGGSGGYGDSGDRGGHGGYGGHDAGYGGDSGGRGGHGGYGGHDGGYGGHDGGYGGHGGRGGHHGHGGAYAGGHTGGSPGVGSGNEAQVPIDVPVNACGNSVDVIGLLNPVFGNDCDNGYGGHHHTTPPRDTGRTTPPRTPEQPGKPVQPTTPTGTGRTTGSDTPVTDRTVTPAGETAQLAHTGSELPMGLVLPVGAGALLAGAVLYRKARAWA
ncbi:chaplin [Streptomyces sp. NPDC002265]|uniref:chaplin n=1 Tax=Streptomyces sp. NPDC002265 TaxID=3154415 RepID=UPI003320A261